MSGELIQIERDRECSDRKYCLFHLTHCRAVGMRHMEMHVLHTRISIKHMKSGS
jgi:hypothetical protein